MPVAGPFYFAWSSGQAEAFNAAGRMDEYIFSFSRSHGEGNQFCLLELEIENPGSGLLAPGHLLWCWFGWDSGGGNIVPLFHGRLVAVPTNLNDRVVTIQFTARPDDYNAQLVAVAETLKVRPFWDEVFIDDAHASDPNATLEARAADWYTDYLTLQVGTTDIVTGEDGTITFQEGDAFIDGFDVRLNGAPLSAVDVDATVAWSQTFPGGSIDLGIFNWSGFGLDQLMTAWPKTGDELSGGWSVVSAATVGSITKATTTTSINISWQNQAKTHRDGDTMSINVSYNGPAGGPAAGGVVTKNSIIVGDSFYGTPASSEFASEGVMLGRGGQGTAKTAITLGYGGVGRDRTEKLTFTVRSDLQPVLRNPNDPEVPDKISISGKNVGQGGQIGDASLPSYFMTDRGNWSVEYLISLAVAKLKLGGRVVNIGWGCEFSKAVTLTLRQNGALFDRRLVGGTAVGKIISHTITGNGDSGQFVGQVKIASCLGLGNAIVEQPGTPTYVDEGYVDPPYQMYENQVIVIGTGDVGYSPPIIIPNDDGLVFPLTRDQVVVKMIQHRNEIPVGTKPLPKPTAIDLSRIAEANLGNPPATLFAFQQALIQWQAQQTALYQNWLELELVSLDAGNFGSEATVAVTNLVLPKGYDLAAV